MARKPVEKRIYVVVAETVDCGDMGVVVQVPGRMAAQACHAVSRMKMHRIIRFLFAGFVRKLKAIAYKPDLERIADEEITTIILSCRDTDELYHVCGLLNHLAKPPIPFYTFHDTNPEVYGPGKVFTALATVPVDPAKVEGITDYLPLWDPKKETK